MNELHLFAGAGGGILGGQLLGHSTVCAVEIDPYCRRVLLQRQRDGMLPRFPIWDDVRTFDGTPWRGRVDVVAGGFPCQDISWAWRGKGLEGERSGLWVEMHRIIQEVQPRYAFIENVGNIRARGLDTVRSMLSDIGYRSADGDFYASDCGSPHLRKRTFLLAKRDWEEVVLAGDCEECPMCGEPICPRCRIHHSECPCPGLTEEGWRLEKEDWGFVAYPDGTGCEEQRGASPVQEEHMALECHRWWESEPDVDRLAHGVASRVDRLRALGNGQVPAVAALAWQTLIGEL